MIEAGGICDPPPARNGRLSQANLSEGVYEPLSVSMGGANLDSRLASTELARKVVKVVESSKRQSHQGQANAVQISDGLSAMNAQAQAYPKISPRAIPRIVPPTHRINASTRTILSRDCPSIPIALSMPISDRIRSDRSL